MMQVKDSKRPLLSDRLMGQEGVTGAGDPLGHRCLLRFGIAQARLAGA